MHAYIQDAIQKGLTYHMEYKSIVRRFSKLKAASCTDEQERMSPLPTPHSSSEGPSGSSRGRGDVFTWAPKMATCKE